MGTIVLESVRTHRDRSGRHYPEFRLKGNSAGFWVERRRTGFIVDRVVQMYDRFDTYWTNCQDDAARRFQRIAGVS